MAETLHGTVERVTFHSPESGYAVLRAQVRGRRGLSTVVGNVVSVTAGEHFSAAGSCAVSITSIRSPKTVPWAHPEVCTFFFIFCS